MPAIKCKQCDGTGDEAYDLLPYANEYIFCRCRVCEGSGIENFCTFCKGTGQGDWANDTCRKCQGKRHELASIKVTFPTNFRKRLQHSEGINSFFKPIKGFRRIIKETYTETYTETDYRFEKYINNPPSLDYNSKKEKVIQKLSHLILLIEHLPEEKADNILENYFDLITEATEKNIKSIKYWQESNQEDLPTIEEGDAIEL